MNRLIWVTTVAIALVFSVASAQPQSTQNAQLAELNSLKEKVKDPDTRTRVAASHRVWTIALASDNPEVKILALDLMKEPLGSASDHIRIPAVYAVVEIANSTADPTVKSKALAALRAPMAAGQLPIRLAALDAVNSILCSATTGDLALEAVELLAEPVRSGNNGIRMPAINAVSHVALASNDDRALSAAIELMQAPLASTALIGGMEVRMMAVVEVEKLALKTHQAATKTKAIEMLQAGATNNLWEPEAQRRATDAAARIRSTMTEAPLPSAAATAGRLSVSSTPEGADIEVDGNFVGNTPSQLSIPEGDHMIHIKKTGFAPWERKLKVSAGSMVRVDAELEKAP